MLTSHFLRSDERGATMVTVAITMVLLMGMSAIAVDLGLAFAEKRTDQIGADTAVMAGAIDLVQGGDADDIATVIMSFVDTNIRPTTIAEWEACVDADPLPLNMRDDAAVLGATLVQTHCISFDGLEKLRVRVPDQGVDTTFGAILGFDIIDVAAAAEALGIQLLTIGSPPPFALLDGHGAGEVVCLRTGPVGNPPNMMDGMGPDMAAMRGTEPDPCDDTAYPVDTETFGLLNPWVYFDDDGSLTCKQNANDYFIAAGIDHPLSTYLGKYNDGWDPGDPQVQDGSACPTGITFGPDTMRVKTGLTAQELRCGMLTTRGGVCRNLVPGPSGTSLSSAARLHQGDHVQTTYRFLGEQMDNAPLWGFFTGTDNNGDGITDVVSFANAPNACWELADVINGVDLRDWDYYDMRDQLLRCLRAWNSTHAPIFTAAIWGSSRFAFIPLLAESTLNTLAGPPSGPSPCPDSGGECAHIDDFVPVWLQTLYTVQPSAACDDKDLTPGNTWGLHHAGQPNSCGDNTGNLDRLSAIVIDCGMLPRALCDARPGPPGSTPGGDVTPHLELTR